MNSGVKDFVHKPVLLKESLDLFEPIAGKCFADLTFGEGGHTNDLLRRGAAAVFGFDRDKQTIDRYLLQGEFRDDKRLKLFHANYSEIESCLPADSIDGILADLGVSTRQLLEAERGFSFQFSGPLDMRMDTASGMPLSEILEDISPNRLAEQLERNTDLKKSKKVAEQILSAFKAGKIRETSDLAELFSGRHGPSHPATVIFLGLRMLVNEELDEIEKGLTGALHCLKKGGRLVVITFHSSEDRWVKRLLNRSAGKCACGATDSLTCTCPRKKVTQLILKHPAVPTREEMRSNPRSRSAKLRCVEKL